MDGLPADHLERLVRAHWALEGLSIGDGFGAHANISYSSKPPEQRQLPPVPWRHTDDTAMACAVYEVLRDHGTIDQDRLADTFVQRYRQDRGRGYSNATQDVLVQIGKGMSWRDARWRPAEGQGSQGNGGAMRVAPVGAYFSVPGSTDFTEVVRQARASSEVTHAHPEGIAGAIAAAVAAAWAVQVADGQGNLPALLDVVHRWVPDGTVRQRIAAARRLPEELSPAEGAHRLGSGTRADESVVFSLWCASRFGATFEEALWAALAGDGDRDTNCAIVGAVVALSHGAGGVPPKWLRCREALDLIDL